MSLEPLGLTARPEPTADALLAMSDLHPAESELPTLRCGFADARARVRGLYAVSEAGAEPPGLIFRATP